MQSQHNTWLPTTIREAHIVPGLTQMSLISTQKFCDAGCKVTFDVNECRVYYLDKLVLVGTRDAIKRDHGKSQSIHRQSKHHCYPISSYTHQNIQQVNSITWEQMYTLYHQAFFNPLIHTLIIKPSI